MNDKSETRTNDDMGETGLCETCLNADQCGTVGIIGCDEYDRDDNRKKLLKQEREKKEK